MTIDEFNALIESAYEAAFAYEETLTEQYQAAFRRASIESATKFKAQVVTASFVAPPVDQITTGMTEAEQAKVNATRDRAAIAIADALISIGLVGVAAAFMEAIAQRGQLNFEQEITKSIRNILDQALAEGWTADQTAIALSERFKDVSSSTAQMLAQTELTSLVNERSLEAAQKQFQDKTGPVYKVWETMKDPRVRPAHATTQSQTVPIAQPFNVGGYLMMYPGDPAAPLQLTARCRCRMTYSESLTASADSWYEQADPWYTEQLTASASMLEEALARNPSRVIIEYDQAQPDLPPEGWPDLDREVSYQIKFFYGHGFWSGKQQSGGPAFSTEEMARVMQLAVLVSTDPERPISKVTRDRLEYKGLLY